MRSAVFAFAFAAQVFAADPLPALDADRAVTVSGVSSGGYMAVQFHVAHSATVKGVGAIAGGPYFCARGSLWTAYYNCMTPGNNSPLPATAVLRAEAEKLAKAGTIDATSNLAAARVWLFSGMNDRTVVPVVVQALRAFYLSYNASPVLIAGTSAGHAMVTENAGNPECSITRTPFINDCNYDAAGELLKQLLGKLNPPAAKEGGRLVRFDQKPFGAYSISMDDDAFVYIPKACEGERCRVHVVFHGCRQNLRDIGERFVREAGYNRWADTNRVIVLYPQTIVRYWWIYNPNACWDWWGYTGQQYHTKDGPQIRAVQAMLERLSAPRK